MYFQTQSKPVGFLHVAIVSQCRTSSDLVQHHTDSVTVSVQNHGGSVSDSVWHHSGDSVQVRSQLAVFDVGPLISQLLCCVVLC